MFGTAVEAQAQNYQNRTAAAAATTVVLLQNKAKIGHGSATRIIETNSSPKRCTRDIYFSLAGRRWVIGFFGGNLVYLLTCHRIVGITLLLLSIEQKNRPVDGGLKRNQLQFMTNPDPVLRSIVFVWFIKIINNTLERGLYVQEIYEMPRRMSLCFFVQPGEADYHREEAVVGDLIDYTGRFANRRWLVILLVTNLRQIVVLLIENPPPLEVALKSYLFSINR